VTVAALRPVAPFKTPSFALRIQADPQAAIVGCQRFEFARDESLYLCPLIVTKSPPGRRAFL
jgi:hypothetical protein